MPYVKIETNQPTDEKADQELSKKTSAFIAGLLGKQEQWVMAAVRQGMPIAFDGTSDPAAYVELKSISLGQEDCPGLCQKIGDFIRQEFSVPPDRIYIEFTTINGAMFGWNGKTFR